MSVVDQQLVVGSVEQLVVELVVEQKFQSTNQLLAVELVEQMAVESVAQLQLLAAVVSTNRLAVVSVDYRIEELMG